MWQFMASYYVNCVIFIISERKRNHYCSPFVHFYVDVLVDVLVCLFFICCVVMFLFLQHDYNGFDRVE